MAIARLRQRSQRRTLEKVDLSALDVAAVAANLPVAHDEHMRLRLALVDDNVTLARSDQSRVGVGIVQGSGQVNGSQTTNAERCENRKHLLLSTMQ